MNIGIKVIALQVTNDHGNIQKKSDMITSREKSAPIDIEHKDIKTLN